MRHILKKFNSIIIVCFMLSVADVDAAMTDLATTPLVTNVAITVLPNIFFMMDDSGSMDWDFMPDDANSPYFATTTYGYASSQCNGTFYNPSITYTAPLKADGTSYAASSFTGAWMDGFKQSTVVNLSTNFKLGLDQSNTTVPTGGSAAYYYNYTGTQITPTQKNYLSTSSVFYKECNSTISSTPGSSVFQKVLVSATSGPNSTDERQNYANWFSYYRTRLNMMKTGAGLAFSALGSNYRVGFATMNNNGSNQFSPLASFDSVQKTQWYNKLYSTSAGSSTPLLMALSNVGLMYANKLPNNKMNGVVAGDPIQYECQQNFVILSTDGYWNDQTNQTLTTGPSKTAVGDQDSSESRPMFDGGFSSMTKTTTQLQKNQTQQLETKVRLQSQTSQLQVSTSQVQAATSQVKVSTSQVQLSTSQIYKTTTQIEKATAQIQKSTSQVQVSTSQIKVSTSQVQLSTSQIYKTITQIEKTTTQIQKSTSQIQESTSQIVRGRTVTTGPTNVSSCTPGTANGITTTCSTVTTGPSNASSCSAGTVNGLTTTCSNVSVSGPAAASSCTAGTSNTGLVTTCSNTPVSGPSAASSCTAGTSNTGLVTTCSTVTTGPSNASSCTPSNVNGLTTTCSTVTTGPSNANTCTAGTTNGLTTTCSTVNTGPSNASTCTPSNVNGLTTSCSTVNTGPSNASTCTAGTTNGLTTTCTTVPVSGSAAAPSCTAGTSNTGLVTTCSNAPVSGPTAVSSCTAGTSNTGLVTTCSTVTTGPSNASTCTASTSNGLTTTCSTVTTGPSNASSCTAGTSNGLTTTCSTVTTGPSNVSTCTAGTSNGLTTTCSTVTTGPSNASTCSAATVNGLTTTCPTVVTGPTNVSTCTPSSVGGLTTTCPTVPISGPTVVASCVSGSSNGILTACSTNIVSTGVPVQTCAASSPTTANGYTTTSCNTVTNSTTVTVCNTQSASAQNNWTTTACSTPTITGGTYNSLADVAEYYWKTDLRTSALGNCTGNVGLDVCENKVPPMNLDDIATWQHMTTFSLGLGAPGRMIYSPSYRTDSSGDFFSVANGVTASASVCTWQTTGQCNWPFPNPSGAAENIDDLWHAAVDGRGFYYSATNPSELAIALNGTLRTLQSVTGNSSSATINNPSNINIKFKYINKSFYKTVDWTGQLISQLIDLTTGYVPKYNSADSSTYVWDAQTLLDAKKSRIIYASDNNTLPSLIAFNAQNFANSPYFNQPNISDLSQFCPSGSKCLSAASKVDAAGANLVNYLVGDTSHQGAVSGNSPYAYYRPREHILGDIVNSTVAYVGNTDNNFTDLGFSAYKESIACRQPMVYVGVNDGFLHAFFATSDPISDDKHTCQKTAMVAGDEAWAYAPSFVMNKLYKLADEEYSSNHQFYVDGSPITEDICLNNCGSLSTNPTWGTILVGGLNNGGRGYYALDITDPLLPKLLWEFSDVNMGQTYGDPVITKLNDGTWVVLLTSGYNNTSPGDGQGRLYVLNASNGAIIRQISTGVGNMTTPSGLTHISAATNTDFINASGVDVTSLNVYGGDLQGNLWRFEINPQKGVYNVQRLVTFFDASGVPQPIAVNPEMALVNNTVVIYVGTGILLGNSDLTTTQQQTLYAVKDTGANVTGNALWASPHVSTCDVKITNNCFVNQSVSTALCPAGSTYCSDGSKIYISSNNPVSINSQNGWYIDLPDNGERANTDPYLINGTLVFNTNIPKVSTCTVGGYSNQYQVKYETGTSVNSAELPQFIGVFLGNAFASAPVSFTLANGSTFLYTTLSNGEDATTRALLREHTTLTLKRVSWHQIND